MKNILINSCKNNNNQRGWCTMYMSYEVPNSNCLNFFFYKQKSDIEFGMHKKRDKVQYPTITQIYIKNKLIHIKKTLQKLRAKTNFSAISCFPWPFRNLFFLFLLFCVLIYQATFNFIKF